MEPQPQVQIVDFYKANKFKVQAGAGYQWEHIDFQQGAKAHPALKKAFVRQAIITGINRGTDPRGAVRQDGSRQVGQGAGSFRATSSSRSSRSTDAVARWKLTQRNAIAMLKKGGCTGGPDTPTPATRRSSAARASAS